MVVLRLVRVVKVVKVVREMVVVKMIMWVIRVDVRLMMVVNMI